MNMPANSLKDRDFTAIQFIGAQISDIPSMFGANFTDANLPYSTFEKCNLSGAIFDGANLKGTQFINCTGYGGLLGNTNAQTILKIIERAFRARQSDAPPPINMDLFHACVELARMPENQPLAVDAPELALRIRKGFAELDENSSPAASATPTIPN